MTLGTGRMFDPRPAPYFAIPQTTVSEVLKNERSLHRIVRDAQCRNGDAYSLEEFTDDLFRRRDVDMTNFQLRVDTMSKTEGITFEDAREVGDAVLEVLKSRHTIPSGIDAMDRKVLEITGLDALLEP